MNATVHRPAERWVMPSTCQPSKADLEEEIGMPSAGMDTLREAFFKPIKTEERELS